MSLARRALFRLTLPLPGALAGATLATPASATPPLATPALAHGPQGLLGRVLRRGSLRVGVWLDSPPFGFRLPGGGMGGMEVELARDIARSLDVTAELIPLALSDRVAAVALGHVDLACATIIVSPERMRRVAFAHPHGLVLNLLVTTGLRPVVNMSELAGRRVMGRSDAIFAPGLDLPPDTERVIARNDAEALAALMAGQAAALLMPEPAFRDLGLAHPEAQLHGRRITDEAPYAVALPLGEPDLLRFLNTWVFLREEDGTFATLHETFMSAPRPPIARL